MRQSNAPISAKEAMAGLLRQNSNLAGVNLPGAAPKQDRHNRGKAGKREDVANRYFRSAAEANYARFLNLCVERSMMGIVKWEYEVAEFEFPIKRGERFYKPDFKVWFKDGSYQWHEVKGWMDQKSKTKLKRFEKYHKAEHARLIIVDMNRMKEIHRSFGPLIPMWESGQSSQP